MTYSFNLINEPWIPCIRLDGKMEEFGLRQVLLQAHELRSIQGDSSLETAGIFRLLLALLHSALRGPRTTDAWGQVWEQGHWLLDIIDRYLDRWGDRFDLFHPVNPFYQTQDDRVKPKSISSLVIDMVSGNNAVLFDHHLDETGVALLPAKAARTLIAAQTFSLAGLSGIPGKAFTDSPWGRGIIFLVEGNTLFKSLVLNLLKYPDERNNIASSHNDCPAWEQENTYLPERQIPFGYLDYLTWQSRHIMLIPEGEEHKPVVRLMTVAPGLRLDMAMFDPFKLYRRGKGKGNEELWLITRFSEDRSLWRDSASLFGLKGSDGKPPQTFYWMADLADRYISWSQKLRFVALGMANDQAKVEFFQEDHLPLSLEYLEKEDLVNELRNCLDKAEKTRFSLKIASQWLALLIISPHSDGKNWKEVDPISKDQADNLVIHWNVDRYFWQQLEIPFLQLLQDLPNQRGASDAWYKTVKQTAWDALERTIGFAGTNAPALKAAVRARGMLGAMLNELFPNET